MAPNVLLLRQVLEQIETHPETWDQGVYRCGTSMCFAGWAAELSGGTWIGQSELLVAAADEESSSHWGRDGIAVVSPEVRAGRVLGLDGDQADDLFDAANSLESIREQIIALAALVHHVTIRIVPYDELTPGEATPDGRSPLEVMENRPGQSPMFHGGELGIALERLADHARVVANRLGVPYVDPIDPAAVKRLARAVAA